MQEGLSQRVSRVSELLCTRVGIALQQQTQAILSDTAKRAKLQLRLQQTVEGLSGAAISYYVVALIGYVASAATAAGAAVDPDIVKRIAIPIFLALAALGVQHMRRAVQRATT